MKPYLSIIVPIYKVEQYIHKCLDSIMEQTFSDFELILVDDGSPDNCPSICAEYAKRDSRVKVIHKDNGGLVSARKAGLEVALGQYIGFVDSDDWIERTMYENMCGAAKQYGTDIIICDAIYSYKDREIMYAQNIEPGFYDKARLLKDIYPTMIYFNGFYKFGLLPAVWNKIFKRQLLSDNLSYVDNYIRTGEDAACTYPCLLDANSVYVLNQNYLYHYRQRASSMTRNYDEKYLDRILLLYRLLKDKNREKDVYDLAAQLYYYLTFLVTLALDNEYSVFNTKDNREKRRFIKNACKIEEINEALNNISLKGIQIKSKIYIWFLKRRSSMIIHLIVLFTRYKRTLYDNDNCWG